VPEVSGMNKNLEVGQATADWEEPPSSRMTIGLWR
jgi:hypothetical protein